MVEALAAWTLTRTAYFQDQDAAQFGAPRFAAFRIFGALPNASI